MMEVIVYHIYPAQDIEPHSLCCEQETPVSEPVCLCPCGPTMMLTPDGDYVVRHNSFAGEVIDWVKDFLENTKPFE